MKRKELLLLLSLALLAGACGNASKRTAQPASSSTEKTAVDQSAGYQVIEALSKIYSDYPNVRGGFIGSSRCPSFLEGMYFDGGTLVFQVRGDTAQARRTLEQAAGSSAFQLEQVKEGTYSQLQLHKIVEEINQRYNALPQNSLLRKNMNSWGPTAHCIYVRFIQNTPEARREFREKLSDSPAIRFEGPEQPEVNETVGITETHGISLHPEYSVYADTANTASFLLINRSNRELMCGEHYSITYEDEQGTWRTLPINTFAVDIGYLVPPGGHYRFVAHLYPDIHRNKPGRYRFFYGARINETGRKLNMMTEFRLTDNEQEVKQAVRMEIVKTDTTSYISVEDWDDDTDGIYEVVEQMPEFPGGLPVLMKYIKANIRYPEASRKANIQGRVIVQFVVMEDGSIEQAHVVRSINPELDEEALRIVDSMPRWKPGKQAGKAVKVRYKIPVTFRPE